MILLNPIIRKLREEDAKESAHNIAQIWNITYKGIVDEDYLKELYEHENDSARRIKENITNDLNYYVMVLNNKIIGWTYYEYSTDKLVDAAEIHSLYILKDYQNKGYEKILLNYATNDIKNHKINKLIIGCLEGNTSNDFYKHMGGKYIKTQLFREKYNENIHLFEL